MRKFLPTDFEVLFLVGGISIDLGEDFCLKTDMVEKKCPLSAVKRDI